MTATLHLQAPSRPHGRAAPAAASGPSGPRSPLRPGAVVVLAATLSAGLALLLVSYHLAAVGSLRQLQFALFWAGLLGGTLPLTVLAGHRGLRAMERAALVLTLAAYTTVPKLLRNGGEPLFSDEFAHWRQTHLLLETGLVDHTSPLIKALPAFPGLHLVTAQLAQVSGVSVWTAATVVMVGAHLVALLGVFTLLSQAAGPRVGAIGAALYTTNPSWLFFDVQFAYETLALPLVLWAMVFSVRTVTGAGSERVASAVMALVLTAAAAVTHHLSTIVLILLMTAHAAVVSVRRRRGESLPSAWLLVAGLVGAGLVWLVPQWQLLVGYLGPSLTRSWVQLQALLGKLTGAAPPVADRHARTQHQLFAGTALPPYEVLSGLAVPFILLGLVAALAVVARRRRRAGLPPVLPLAALPSHTLVLTGVALLYFASLPFLLTAGGSEGARRSWAFSFLGLAMLAAAYSVWLLQRARRRGRARARRLLAGMLAALAVVTVGNIAVGQNEAYRFPGPYTTGSDTLSQDEEKRAVADWMRTHVGAGNRVVADRYLGLSLGSVGDQRLARPSDGFPVWDLVFKDTPPGAELIRQLSTSSFVYLVVDQRMAQEGPAMGRWFTVDEPKRRGGTVPAAALKRFQCLPWTSAVYAGEHLTVYRLDFSSYNAAATAAAARDCR